MLTMLLCNMQCAECHHTDPYNIHVYIDMHVYAYGRCEVRERSQDIRVKVSAFIGAMHSEVCCYRAMIGSAMTI